MKTDGDPDDHDPRRVDESKLRAKEAEVRSLVENTPDVIVRWDRELRRVFVNRAFADAAGVQAEAALGGRFGDGAGPEARDAHAIAEALLPHLDFEEEILFPRLLQEAPDTVLIARELDAMVAEHRGVGELLASIREAADDFTLPAWACNSYRALFAELEHLEADVLTHVHLENHALMPRFVRPEVRS